MTEAVVVFDLDGTLVDSRDDIHDALRFALKHVPDGKESDEADEQALRTGCHGIPLDRFLFQARPRAGEAALDAFVACYRRYYHAHLLDRTRPFAGVTDGLARLQALRPRLHLAVATTKPTPTARLVTDGLGLSPLFDLVLGTDGLPCKPDPAVLHAVYRHLGHAGPTTPGHPPRPRGLMVGDTDHDIMAGRGAGLLTCAVGWSALPREVLVAAGPDHHAGSFAEVVELVLDLLSPRPA